MKNDRGVVGDAFLRTAISVCSGVCYQGVNPFAANGKAFQPGGGFTKGWTLTQWQQLDLATSYRAVAGPNHLEFPA